MSRTQDQINHPVAASYAGIDVSKDKLEIGSIVQFVHKHFIIAQQKYSPTRIAPKASLPNFVMAISKIPKLN